MIERELEATEEDDESEEEDDFVVAVSFFTAPGDADVDEKVCSAIGNMWSKARSGGIARTLREQLEAQHGAAIETNDTCREDTMAKTEEEIPKRKHGQLLELVLAAYHELSKKNGEAPKARAIFEHLGEVVAKSQNNVYIALKRLETRGDIGLNKTSRATPAASISPPVPKKRSAPRVVNGGGHATSKGPVVLSRDFGTLPIRPEIAAKADADPGLAAVIRKRNELADRVAQLTHVIETW